MAEPLNSTFSGVATIHRNCRDHACRAQGTCCLRRWVADAQLDPAALDEFLGQSRKLADQWLA